MDVRKAPLKVLLTGCYAPPYGGASIYVKRLFDYLVDKGHACQVLDMFSEKDAPGPPGVVRTGTKERLYFRILSSSRNDILHINESMWRHRAILILLARFRGTKSVLTLHSFRDKAEDLGWMNRFMLKYTLKHADFIISPGKKEMERVLELFPDKKDIAVITPFIPPDIRGCDPVLPEELRAFIARYPIVLSANGSNLDFFEGGDIYGLDLMVELCRRLNETVNAAVIYCLSYNNNPAYLERIAHRISDYALGDRFLIYTEEIEFWKVIVGTTAFIRPTGTDSSGISVADGGAC